MATYLPGSTLPILPHCQVVGVTSSSTTVYVTIGLKPRFPAEFEAFVRSVSDPRSPSYRQWLTPAQVGAQFGAAPSTVSAVVNYLRSKGMTITLQSPNMTAITARGTVAQVQNAFGAAIKNYSGPDGRGHTISFRANSTLLNLPSAWEPQVQGISGIENWTRPVPLAQTQTLTPALVRGLYNSKVGFNLGFQGLGATTGVSNWDGFSISQNVPLFCTREGLPVPAGGAGSNCQVVTIAGGSQGNPPDGEGDLDIQMELSMIPLGTVIVYDGGADEISVLAKEAADNTADVISESWIWGYGPNSATAAMGHTQHLAMSAQGQTYMTATGDDGTATYTDFSGAYPQCDPEVLGVGGTTATVDSSTGARISEVPWAGSGAGGGGWITDGDSFTNTRPSWQHGPGIPNQPNFVLRPDVAIHAGNVNFTCYEFYAGGGLSGANGTSFASPQFASNLALLETRLAAVGIPQRMGHIQELVYQQAGRSDVWYDITTGPSIGTLPDGSDAAPHAGWDFATGWGAPDFDALFNTFVGTVTATPFFPDGVSTVVGDYIIGDPSSVATSDGIYYQIGSVGIPLFGQAAGAGISFTIPENALAISIDLEANSGGEGAGTNMVWLLNQQTGNYDLIGSVPMKTSGSADQIINVRPTDVPLYVGPGGTVSMIVRGHVPIRPFNNQLPVPFTYKIDEVSLLVR